MVWFNRLANFARFGHGFRKVYRWFSMVCRWFSMAIWFGSAFYSRIPSQNYFHTLVGVGIYGGDA